MPKVSSPQIAFAHKPHGMKTKPGLEPMEFLIALTITEPYFDVTLTFVLFLIPSLIMSASSIKADGGAVKVFF